MNALKTVLKIILETELIVFIPPLLNFLAIITRLKKIEYKKSKKRIYFIAKFKKSQTKK